ncbi:hypothetical protein [Actinomadura rubrisoli]|uniref:hypothetical protein n=1 Tax=Actinomadura rubrisoli TaxID=2530368 RepID=UPI0014052FC5|nr:hypothetical protein [Actinomadura rubrisoli]
MSLFGGSPDQPVQRTISGRRRPPENASPNTLRGYNRAIALLINFLTYPPGRERGA